MKRFAMATVLVVLAGFAGAAVADDKANPTGTWKWSVERNGETFDLTLKLKLEDGKVTGTLTRGDQETKIEDGKFKDGEVSFTVTNERNGQKFTRKYTGKVSGDALKGKIEFERNGETISRDWDAKRSTD
jgi:hypothetical protein